jgi:hypothetical protein
MLAWTVAWFDFFKKSIWVLKRRLRLLAANSGITDEQIATEGLPEKEGFFCSLVTTFTTSDTWM